MSSIPSSLPLETSSERPYLTHRTEDVCKGSEEGIEDIRDGIGNNLHVEDRSTNRGKVC